jgi:2-polyprenyl-3-methyl-5-hydroxy-6-metoxy-1,4-benzoquinol methylase
MFERAEECPICKGHQFENNEIAKDTLVSEESFVITRCVSCGLLITNPRPTPETISKYYESEKYISHHSEKAGLFGWIYRRVRSINLSSKLRLITKNNSQGKILDYGAGTGQFLTFMRAKGWDTYGVELNEEARNQILTKGINASKFLEDIEETKFDVITLWHVLEHVHDINTLIAKLKALLDKKGTMYWAVPNPNSWDAKTYKSHWAGWDVPRHLYHFNQKNIKQLAKLHKLKVIEILPMKWDAYYVSLLSEQNKTGKKNWINSILKGYKSNTYANKTGEYSSLIYVLQHAK